MSAYLLTRGPGALRRKAHIARYDQYGDIAGSWCRRGYNMSSNVPWGRPRCKDCLRRMTRPVTGEKPAP